ncbi:IS5 family transposase [Streptomyces sp. NPDC015140]|uniref:IS5 family transposase n=1 Tax=Streptomyces sp. NPDC015140 TaxID=3364943 RepID=UPI0036F4F82F
MSSADSAAGAGRREKRTAIPPSHRTESHRRLARKLSCSTRKLRAPLRPHPARQQPAPDDGDGPGPSAAAAAAPRRRPQPQHRPHAPDPGMSRTRSMAASATSRASRPCRGRGRPRVGPPCRRATNHYRNGLPLSLGGSGANMHDSQGLKPLVRGIPPVRSRRGPRRRQRPAKLHADKGYDYDHLRGWLRARRIRHRIARKNVESSQRLGRHRWVVERTVSWLAGSRRLHRHYERKAEHFLAFVAIAATLIGYRRLSR